MAVYPFWPEFGKDTKLKKNSLFIVNYRLMAKWQPLEEEAQVLASQNTCNLLTTSM